MFEAVRSRLVGAWRDLHARGLPSLFLFELVVVTLGVLLAQALADVAAERGDKRRADAVLTRLSLHAQNIHDGARLWTAALPCLRARSETVMRNAAAGETIDARIVRRPNFWTVSPSSISPEDWDLVREYHGDEVYSAHVDLRDVNAIFHEDMMIIAARWESFARLDPEFGTPSRSDYDAVRDASADIRSRMRGMGNDLDDLRHLSRQLGIGDKPIIEDGVREVRPLQSCDEIDAAGKTYVPIEGSR